MCSEVRLNSRRCAAFCETTGERRDARLISSGRSLKAHQLERARHLHKFVKEVAMRTHFGKIYVLGVQKAVLRKNVSLIIVAKFIETGHYRSGGGLISEQVNTIAPVV